MNKKLAAQHAIFASKNFQNKLIKHYLLILLEATKKCTDYSLCWLSQAKLAEALDLKATNGRNRTISRINQALKKAGAIKVHYLHQSEARAKFKKRGWIIPKRKDTHRLNFVEVLWSHPVWSGDLSGVSISRTSTGDPKEGQGRGQEDTVTDDAGFDVVEE